MSKKKYPIKKCYAIYNRAEDYLSYWSTIEECLSEITSEFDLDIYEVKYTNIGKYRIETQVIKIEPNKKKVKRATSK